MAEHLLLKLLGGRKAIGNKVERELDFDKEIRRGFRFQVFVSFKANTKLPNKDLFI